MRPLPFDHHGTHLIVAVTIIIVLVSASVAFALTRQNPRQQVSSSVGIPASVFPIAVWDQSPSGGDVPAPFTNQAQAFSAMGVNTFLGLYGWPENFGSDDGELAAAVAQKMYVIAGGDPNSDTSAQSVASVQQLLATVPGSSQYFVGYQWLDEPACTVDIASQIATVQAEDPTRLISANEGAWVADLPNNDIGSAPCLTQAEANFAAPSFGSSDDYADTDPWHDAECEAGNTQTILGPTVAQPDLDCTYLYYQEAENDRALDPTKQIWSFVETGTDDLGLSEENGGIGEEQEATTVQVNSDAWGTIIGGADGIEWFCDGTIAYDQCAGGGGDGVPSGDPTLPDNLTYIDNAIQSFASELTSPNISGSSVTSSNMAVPVVEMLKEVKGTYYLFTESDRIGSTTASFLDPALAGATATVVYDSAVKYDPTNSELGKTFAVSSAGDFSDTLGTTANPYQVKIYAIAPGSVTTTTIAIPRIKITCSGNPVVPPATFTLSCKETG